MIIAGIITGVLAVHFLGNSEQSVLECADDVIARFHQDYPESRIETIIYTADSRSAFFELPDSHVESLVQIGLVHGIGAKFLTRIFDGTTLLEIRKQEDAGLYLRMDDFGWPAANFKFSDTAMRDTVFDWLSVAKQNGSSGDE